MLNEPRVTEVRKSSRTVGKNIDILRTHIPMEHLLAVSLAQCRGDIQDDANLLQLSECLLAQSCPQSTLIQILRNFVEGSLLIVELTLTRDDIRTMTHLRLRITCVGSPVTDGIKLRLCFVREIKRILPHLVALVHKELRLAEILCKGLSLLKGLQNLVVQNLCFLCHRAV